MTWSCRNGTGATWEAPSRAHVATLQSCTSKACIPGIDDKLELSWGLMPLKGLHKRRVCFRHA